MMRTRRIVVSNDLMTREIEIVRRWAGHFARDEIR
jgi:hypothetical protein